MQTLNDLEKVTDFELVVLCRETAGRDDRPFREFMARHQSLVVRICRSRFPLEADAADLVQMVFLRAHRYLGTFDGRAQVSSWLYKIAINVCNNEHRRRKRRPHEYQDRVDLSETDPDELRTTDIPSDASELNALMEALSTLTPDQRRVIELLDLQEKSVREVAKLLGLGQSATKMRALRARKSLRSAYLALTQWSGRK